MAKTTTTIQHEDTNDVDVRINKRKRIIKEFSIVGRLNTLYAENNTDGEVIRWRFEGVNLSLEHNGNVRLVTLP